MKEHYRVVIIGSGFGGIAAAHGLMEQGIEDFVILEKAAAPGGTWHHNRYPGAECDIKSHLYSLSFAPHPGWSQRYARQPEILAYYNRVIDEFGIRRFIRLSCEVTALAWDEATSRWSVTAGNGTFTADAVISAVGMFNEIAMPAIAGLDRFAGQVVHTARWPDGEMFAGKRVAVIGSAATAVQLIPKVAQTAAHLTVFQRTPIWVNAKEDDAYSAEDLALFARDPDSVARSRAEIEAQVNRNILFDDPVVVEKSRLGGRKNLETVMDPALRERLTPAIPYGSRRPIMSNYYYPAFNRANVELVTEGIDHIEESGIRTRDGALHAVDAIVCATGFDVARFASVMDVAGRAGHRLSEDWAEDPYAYMGVMTPGYPNFFMLYGPNTNNGSIITMLEHQARFAVGQIVRMEREGIASLAVRADVTAAYNRQLQRDLDAIAVWQARPDGYYRGKSGRIVTQIPYRMDEYGEMLRAITTDAFEEERAAQAVR